MIERTVVVFPMPFLPRSVTTSPAAMSRSTPKSTLLAPYAVSRFCTLSSKLFPEVGLAHRRVGADLRRRAGGNQAAADQHRDAIREAEHRVHVVLDEEHRHALADLLDQGDHRLRFLRAHAGHRLIEQDELRVGGEGEPDLERALLAVGEVRARDV